MPPTLLKPSSILPAGLRLQVINTTILFKFTEELGTRMQELLDRKKNDMISQTEILELETISELDNILSYINTVIMAQTNVNVRH